MILLIYRCSQGDEPDSETKAPNGARHLNHAERFGRTAQAPNGARNATSDSMNLENSILGNANNMADMGHREIVHSARGR